MSDLTDTLRDIDRYMSIDERYDAAERIDELEEALREIHWNANNCPLVQTLASRALGEHDE